MRQPKSIKTLGLGLVGILFAPLLGCTFTPECDTVPQNVQDPVGMATLPTNGNLLVSSGDLAVQYCGGQVVTVDATSNAVASRIETRLGDETSGRRHLLGEIATNADGTRAFVTERTADRLLVIDLASGSIQTEIALEEDPFAVAFNAATTHVLVSNLGSGSISIVDASSLSVVATITLVEGELGSRPAGIALSRDGARAFVTDQLSNFIHVIDLNSLTEVDTDASADGTNPIEIETGSTAINSRGIAVSPIDGVNEAYLGNRDPDSVVVIDTANLRVVDLIALPSSCDNPDGIVAVASGEIFVACSETDEVAVLDRATRELEREITVGDNPQAMAISPNGQRVYVGNLNDDSISVIDNDPASGTRFTVIATIP
ncbi:MAG: beta-propeller fold lactonase family protein [Deltaproteobacteria bacterium]|nr:beta-propeller fold lactonase family protein [Deltaproteobacteria bacterium]